MTIKRTRRVALLTMLVASQLFAVGAVLSPGKYTAALTSIIDEATADKIENELGQIEEIRSIDVKPKDSSLHFVVKDKLRVDVEKIRDAIRAAAPGTGVSDPMLDSITEGKY